MNDDNWEERSDLFEELDEAELLTVVGGGIIQGLGLIGANGYNNEVSIKSNNVLSFDLSGTNIGIGNKNPDQSLVEANITNRTTYEVYA